MAETQKKNFFVSYNRNDRGWAEWIAWQLEDAGYTTAIQAWDFGVGNDFILQMQKAATECERTLGVLSPDSINAPFVQKEWAAALAADPTGQERKLVLARVRDFKPEGLYRALIYIDLVSLDPDVAKERLLSGLQLGRRKPSTAPLFPGGPPATPTPQSQSTLVLKQPNYFPGKTVSLFLCAAEEDVPRARTLRKHLAVSERNGVLRTWHRGDIQPGMVEQAEIDAHFTEAQILVLLITQDFLASRECFDLMERAKQRSGVCAVPVLVSPSQFDETVFAGTVALPRDKGPITSRRDQDSAWAAIAQELTALAKAIT